MSSKECNDRIELVKLAADTLNNFPLEGDDSTIKRVGWVMTAAASAAGYGASCFIHAENARPAYEALLQAFNNMSPTDRSGWDGNIRDVLINDYYRQRDILIELSQGGATPDPNLVAEWIDNVYDCVIAARCSQIWDDAAWEMGIAGNVPDDLHIDRMKTLYYLPAAFDWHYAELAITFQEIGASKDLYDCLQSAFEYYHYDVDWPLQWASKAKVSVIKCPVKQPL